MAPLPNASYVNGANLGGWLVMENWLFPNVLLLRLGDAGITNNQELDYIWRMRERGIDEVASMHAHWNTFLGGKLLDATEPPPQLKALAAAGVEAVRIPVGWWALEEPAEEYDGPEAVASGSSAPAVRAKYERPGVTSDGFVTGGALYLRALVKWLKVLNMRALVDMHSLPGGAVRTMGYTGAYFRAARAFDGAAEWYADGDASSLPAPPSTLSPFLRNSVVYLLRLAELLASFDDDEETSGVISGFSPWNEALFADNDKAYNLLPPFTLKIVPQLRKILPAERYELVLNFFNNARNWPQWMVENKKALGPNILADLHVYHAFDPPFDPSRPLTPAGCPMCTGGQAGMQSLICKTCHGDAAVLNAYTDLGIKVIVGEWSLGTCQMWGVHPQTIGDVDFLYAMYASAKSTFYTSGAVADYFWTASIATGGYDPTLYKEEGGGSRGSVLAELSPLSHDFAWAAQNAYIAPPSQGVGGWYLLNWHYNALASANTSEGHPIAMPLRSEVEVAAAAAAAEEKGFARSHTKKLVQALPMTANAACNYTPVAPARIRDAVDALETCDGLCGTERAIELSVGGTAIIVLTGVLVGCIRAFCRARKARRSGGGSGGNGGGTGRRRSRSRSHEADGGGEEVVVMAPTEEVLRKSLQRPLMS